MKVRVLGCSGAIAQGCKTTSCQLAVELVAAFGRGCTTEGHFNDVDGTVLTDCP